MNHESWLGGMAEGTFGTSQCGGVVWPHRLLDGGITCATWRCTPSDACVLLLVWTRRESGQAQACPTWVVHTAHGWERQPNVGTVYQGCKPRAQNMSHWRLSTVQYADSKSCDWLTCRLSCWRAWQSSSRPRQLHGAPSKALRRNYRCTRGELVDCLCIHTCQAQAWAFAAASLWQPCITAYRMTRTLVCV